MRNVTLENGERSTEFLCTFFDLHLFEGSKGFLYRLWREYEHLILLLCIDLSSGWISPAVR